MFVAILMTFVLLLLFLAVILIPSMAAIGGPAERRNKKKSGYFEYLDQSAFKRKHVLHHLIDYQSSVHCVHNLMDIHRNFVAIALKTLRVNTRVQHFPLARPVVSDSLVALNIASIHAVGPSHVRSHAGQAAVDVAGVEGAIELG